MIGKTVGCNTFGDLADLCVWIMGTEYGRIDVVCNIYMKLSIKGSTCNRRKWSINNIRRLVNSRLIPLPIISGSSGYNEDLLSDEQAPSNKCVMVAGGMGNVSTECSSSMDIDISSLKADHEESDTCRVLHWTHHLMELLYLQETPMCFLLL